MNGKPIVIYSGGGPSGGRGRYTPTREDDIHPDGRETPDLVVSDK